ncbi:MAG: hypothetical protein JXA19_05260 [Anaerolineales bacterium]|nr:hypothetical protein [Anaerolineales bacterium]
MTDSKRSCLGILSMLAALVFSVLILVAGGFGALIKWMGGNFLWLDLRVGTILAVAIFLFFSCIAIYMFVKVKDYSWFPMILSGLYAILPDLIFGSNDDILVLILGAGISSMMAWRNNKKTGKSVIEIPEPPLLDE